ncbi:oxysterol-binding protein [Ditylenchus destructor]|nr:oxysterol-binding protein [Ditylenchus destructor]
MFQPPTLDYSPLSLFQQSTFFLRSKGIRFTSSKDISIDRMSHSQSSTTISSCSLSLRENSAKSTSQLSDLLHTQLHLARSSVATPKVTTQTVATPRKKKKNRKGATAISGQINSIYPAALLLKAALDQPLLEQAILTTGETYTSYDYDLALHRDSESLDACSSLDTSLDACLKELQDCENTLAIQSAELASILSKIESGTVNFGSPSRSTSSTAPLSPISFHHIRNLKERISLFRITSRAMTDTAIKFYKFAEQKTPCSSCGQSQHCAQKLNGRINELDGLEENNDEQFFDAIDSSTHLFSHRSRARTQGGIQSEHTMLEKNLSSTCLPSFQPDSPQKTMRQRRKRVPFRPANSINYLSLMKNCIGKDLSKIPMPVDFNEPLSALQRATEDLEYSHLLDSASTEHANPARRLALVAAFAISTYSTTGMRTTKPFNPMLGETFECDRRVDKSWRSVAEQVSHHPPTYALYAEGKSWILNQSYTITTKIKGRMSGRLQTDNYGDLVIFNSTTGDKCMLKFHDQGGLFSREVARKVSGTVVDSANKPKYRVEAIWDQYANIYHLDSNENIKPEERLWTANKPPSSSN